MTRCRSAIESARCGAPRRDGAGGTSLAATTAPRGTTRTPAAGGDADRAVVQGHDLAEGVGEAVVQAVAHDGAHADAQPVERVD